MLFLAEFDHVKSGATLTPEAGRAFIEQVIFATLARAEQLVAEKKILGGGAVVWTDCATIHRRSGLVRGG